MTATHYTNQSLFTFSYSVLIIVVCVGGAVISLIFSDGTPKVQLLSQVVAKIDTFYISLLFGILKHKQRIFVLFHI